MCNYVYCFVKLLFVEKKKKKKKKKCTCSEYIDGYLLIQKVSKKPKNAVLSANN